MKKLLFYFVAGSVFSLSVVVAEDYVAMDTSVANEVQSVCSQVWEDDYENYYETHNPYYASGKSICLSHSPSDVHTVIQVNEVYEAVTRYGEKDIYAISSSSKETEPSL